MTGTGGVGGTDGNMGTCVAGMVKDMFWYMYLFVLHEIK